MKHYLNFAIQSIKHRKVRSWLTILGIIVGIAAIVSLISLSQGLQNAIQQQFEDMGANKFFVLPKSSAGLFGLESGKITNDDADTISGVSGVNYVSSYLMGNFNVIYGKEEKYNSVIGFESEKTPQEFFEGDGIKIDQGRWPQKNEKGIIILGSSFAKDAYKKEIYIGNKLEIEGQKFEVIAILQPIGNEQDDNQIYVAMDDERDLLEDPDGLTMIEVEIMEGFDINEVAQDAKTKLERARDAEDIEVYTPDQILKQLGVILSVVQVVLVGIAAISLFVGAIGIMNSMFTNVLERKKEIGIMKSIGASPKDIKYIFMVEAGLMGLIGGILGALLGVFISFSVGEIAANAGFLLLKIQVEWYVIIFSILFAFIVGIISGYIPANNASKLTPVEALKE